MEKKQKNTTLIAVIGGIIVAVILLAGTLWVGTAARDGTEEAVRTVSLMYLDELADRREAVVSSNLQYYIDKMNVSVSMLTDEDLSDREHLQQFQRRIKQMFELDRYAFVGENGDVYAATGDIYRAEDYDFDYKNLTGPVVSIRYLEDNRKEAVIAVPMDPVGYGDDKLIACLIEIDMEKLLEGVSMASDEEDATFCNIYTPDGVALTDTILGGLAVEDNLLEALQHAEFSSGFSYEKTAEDFAEGRRGAVSFTYDGIEETLSYIPIRGTDWMLTYLVREGVIADRISYITNGMVIRNILLSLLTALVLIGIFLYIIRENRKNAAELSEKEAAAAASRAKQEEMEQRLALQAQLLEQKTLSEEQSRLITALCSDYRSVYYIEIDRNEGVCYQARTDIPGFAAGERFKYLEAVTEYCNHYVLEQFRDDFLAFIQPEAVLRSLEDNPVISYTYMISVDGKESYEMVKFAGVKETGGNEDHQIHNVGACFTDVDAETRRSIVQNQTLSDALATAEEANRAKTAFLSNMSHEIRTPMNAIIGLDNIAINDPETPDKIRGYLQKIGDSAEHLLHLINDILDMSRIESGRMTMRNEEFSFSKLLETINTMFSGQCSDKGLDYQCHINGQVDDYYIGDIMKLRQVLINILGNAVKFTPEGGRVEFEVERTAKFENQSTLRFTIKDTGIGMSKEFLPHIFDAFAQEDSSSTNKYGSSGLGLAISRSIVEMMNGNIRVDSEKGKGTTFIVTVTLMNAASHGDEEEMVIQAQEMSVLIVDDDPVACDHAKLVLEKAGIASEIASCGADAVEMVRLRHARREPYNLILVDWKMPEMDGVETTRKIREIVGNESAIIILTAYSWDDILEEALQAGVDSFIPKPLFAAAVIDEFRDAMKRKGATKKKHQNKADLSGRRILLAEDVQVNAEIMMMVLQARGMEADLAENGRIAVEKYVSHEPGWYSAILMDMRMPEMDGLEATRRIRAMSREDAEEIPIIALTANAFDEDVQRSLQAGLNAHLSKPVQPESLYETLESLIKE